MIEITSYLRSGADEFVEVGAASTSPPDPRYVEGALDLTVNGVQIMDTSMWDYIDQLWAYLSDMVMDLREEGEASTYLPDQPTRLSFARQDSGRVLVALEARDRRRTATADEDELVAALRTHGSAFFTKMTELVPQNRDSYEDARSRLLESGP